MDRKSDYISIKGARQNNLKNICLELPHNKLIVVTGISGSGKSSLAFETIAAEGRRQYLESIPSFARQFSGRILQAEIDSISGLYPVVSIGQRVSGSNPKSTLGTISEIYDYLRLLFARFGTTEKDIKLSRSLFSFNSPLGACKQCSGLGLEEKISINKLIADPKLTLREGAMVPTLPTGYIMYSQLTIDSLDKVCREHGFSVDIPWEELSEEQQNVVLFGSDRIKVLKGKHSIESRLKWTALKAKPREMGYYTGMINIMEDILRRDRNKNILRFAESVKCSLCKGRRLNNNALSVKYRAHTIDALCDMELNELLRIFKDFQNGNNGERDIIAKVVRDLNYLCKLGIGHLNLSRSTSSLKGGELQRLRLVNQLSAGLSRVLYVFDEPSIGMHPRDTKELISILRELVNKGNTVIVVEHDPEIIKSADWIIETGPKAGINGGEILFNGTLDLFLKESKSDPGPTQKALLQPDRYKAPLNDKELYNLKNCTHNNLQNIDVTFSKSAINVITGVPGAGKESLVYACLLPELKRVINVDHSPIGRTPRSNPATYTGLSNHIRDLFASLDLSKELGYKKGRFSFNNKGGRCEKCEGAGKVQIGMHYMGSIDIPCDKCNGKRFNDDTLKVKYKGKSISDIYKLSINQAVEFFSDKPGILRYLDTLQSLGLGYLKLGQSSTSLSGGEAQRIKLATALAKSHTADTWYILDEPTTGLHYEDTLVLLDALRRLADKGNTIVAIEYQDQFIKAADRIIDMGPGSGREGGRVVYEGAWDGFKDCKESLTSVFINKSVNNERGKATNIDNIYIDKCSTNNLKDIDIVIPHNKISVLTGVSGSGKSSLAFDTLYSEAQSRFIESLSTYSRSFIKQSNIAGADSFRNLTPAVAINRKNLPVSPRSTVGTISGIYEKYRYLYSRIAQDAGLNLSAKEFSFNHESGACAQCGGLGFILKADPNKLVQNWSLSIAEGALTHNSTIKYYGNPHSQFVAILKEAAKALDFDIYTPFKDYCDKELDFIFNGTGDTVWNTEWEYKNKSREGNKAISGVWKGFSNLVQEEYQRSLHNKNLAGIRSLLYEDKCNACKGTRLNKQALSVKTYGLNIAELSELSVNDTINWFNEKSTVHNTKGKIINSVYDNISSVLGTMKKLGLGHIAISRRSSTLSGGEGQRLRLAQQLSGALSGMTFILDEPTIGLHRNDTNALMEVVEELKTKGNTVVIVEHDKEIIKLADHIIEIGPASGKNGGEIIFDGSYNDLLNSNKAITAAYLKEDKLPEVIKRDVSENAFGLRGGKKHNLVDRDFSFNSGGIIALTGVSGSGKSTLIHHVLAPTLKKHKAVNCSSFYDNAGFDQYITVDHRTIDSSSLSTIASYTGVQDNLASLFAASDGAKELGFKKSSFLYRSKEGRCMVCNGRGKIKIAMDFMDDVWNSCDQCGGLRYNERVLSYRINKYSIGELLQLSVDELIAYLNLSSGKYRDSALNILSELSDIGLGHLILGQELSTLSGGEAQRLKLTSSLLESKGQKILFMLDEPSSGLHYKDIDKLIVVFNKLADMGHTILFIEHNPYLISIANQVIEL